MIKLLVSRGLASSGPRMKGTDSQITSAGKLVALVILFAVLVASAFSVAPQLHERFHGSAPHECVATLLSTGKCTLVVATFFPVWNFSQGFTVFIPRHFQAVAPELEFSLLEHAPPAHS